MGNSKYPHHKIDRIPRTWVFCVNCASNLETSFQNCLIKYKYLCFCCGEVVGEVGDRYKLTINSDIEYKVLSFKRNSKIEKLIG